MNSWDSNSHTRTSSSMSEAEDDDPIHVGRAFFFLTTNPENTLISVDSTDEELGCWASVRSKILRLVYNRTILLLFPSPRII